MYLVKPLSQDKGSGRYTMYLPLSPYRFLGAKRADTLCIYQTPCPKRGALQIHWQSLNTHRGKHRSGGAQFFHLINKVANVVIPALNWIQSLADLILGLEVWFLCDESVGEHPADPNHQHFPFLSAQGHRNCGNTSWRCIAVHFVEVVVVGGVPTFF